MEPQWSDTDRATLKNLRKACPSATMSITNPTGIDPGANLGLSGETLTTNHMVHGMAMLRS
jgi:hypothetical protein